MVRLGGIWWSRWGGSRGGGSLSVGQGCRTGGVGDGARFIGGSCSTYTLLFLNQYHCHAWCCQVDEKKKNRRRRRRVCQWADCPPFLQSLSPLYRYYIYIHIHGCSCTFIIIIIMSLKPSSLYVRVCRWTSQRRKRPIARAKLARSTPCTRWPSTRLVKLHCMPRESVVTIKSRLVSEVRQSQCSIKRQRPPRRLCWTCSARFARLDTCMPLSDASTLRLEERRRQREDCMDKLPSILVTCKCYAVSVVWSTLCVWLRRTLLVSFQFFRLNHLLAAHGA